MLINSKADLVRNVRLVWHVTWIGQCLQAGANSVELGALVTLEDSQIDQSHFLVVEAIEVVNYLVAGSFGAMFLKANLKKALDLGQLVTAQAIVELAAAVVAIFK